jgi:nucleotidyltransferase/DNA polymerase involved in DNA repair
LARSLGVKKLQLKSEALEACPSLWIVDGSDLRHYRKHSRLVYDAFRQAVGESYRHVFGDPSSPLEHVMKNVPCQRGAMDEMMGDLTEVVNKLVAEPDKGETTLSKFFQHQEGQPQKTHIFGDDSQCSVVHLVEDQTNTSTTVSFNSAGISKVNRNLSHPRRNIHETHKGSKIACRQRLEVACRLGRFICQSIQNRTKFHTTIGLSVSPLLAKLACGLTKPKAINVLLPWRSSDLIYGMPLRKMPNVGHRTMQALEGAILVEGRFKPERPTTVL